MLQVIGVYGILLKSEFVKKTRLLFVTFKEHGDFLKNSMEIAKNTVW